MQSLRGTRRTGRLRRFVPLVLLVGAVAVFAHHAEPGAASDAVYGIGHTCVVAGGHAAALAPAAPTVFALPVARPVGAVFLLAGSLRPPRGEVVARAGPSGRRFPLRC